MTISTDGQRSVTPGRTADEIARIVFAPSVDANGHYHGMREVYAVMKQGVWIEAPIISAPKAEPSVLVKPSPPEQSASVTQSEVSSDIASPVASAARHSIRRNGASKRGRGPTPRLAPQRSVEGPANED